MTNKPTYADIRASQAYLSRRITHELHENGGVTNDYIQALMDQYEALTKQLKEEA